MERRGGAAELIDVADDRRLLAGTLRDLVVINHLLGGAELSWRALGVAAGGDDGKSLSLLDIGSGAADIPRHLLRRAAATGLRLQVTAAEVSGHAVRLATRWSRNFPALTVERIEPGRLPYVDGSFDIVHASLVLHHLEPAGALALLHEMGRVSRVAVIVNDLQRARRWWVAAWLLARLTTRNPYTRHDAPLSVLRAYRVSELVTLAGQAGLRVERVLTARLGHRYAVVLRHTT